MNYTGVYLYAKAYIAGENKNNKDVEKLFPFVQQTHISAVLQLLISTGKPDSTEEQRAKRVTNTCIYVVRFE